MPDVPLLASTCPVVGCAPHSNLGCSRQCLQSSQRCGLLTPAASTSRARSRHHEADQSDVSSSLRRATGLGVRTPARRSGSSRRFALHGLALVSPRSTSGARQDRRHHALECRASSSQHFGCGARRLRSLLTPSQPALTTPHASRLARASSSTLERSWHRHVRRLAKASG